MLTVRLSCGQGGTKLGEREKSGTWGRTEEAGGGSGREEG